MLTFKSIREFFFKQIKLKGIPPIAVTTFLSVFPHIVGDNYLEFAGIQSIQILYSWHTGIFLAAGTLVYFAILYQKEWFGTPHRSKFGKYFKIFAFAYIGLAAALIPYYLGVGNFFFEAINSMSDGQNSENIMYLVAWTFGISFMLSDMFNGLDGKSGILFKMRTINRSPV